MTYGDVLAKLRQAYEMNRSGLDGLGHQARREGFCQAMSFQIDQDQKNERSFLLDIGSLGGDRISLTVEAGQLRARFSNLSGLLHQCSWDIKFNAKTSVILNVLNSDERRVFSVFVDGIEVDLRANAGIKKFEPDFRRMVLGADLSGGNRARFNFLSNTTSASYLGVDAVIGLLELFKNRPDTPHLRLDGVSFFERLPGGDFRRVIVES